MKTENKNTILFYIGSFLISLLSTYFIWLQTSKYGINLSPDSTVYMKWAQNILDNSINFVITNNDAKWPPLYPITVAVFSKIFQLDPLILARYLNCCLVFLSSLFTILLLKNFSNKLFFSIVFGFFIPFSIPFNFVFSFAWSEPLFIVFLLLITFSIEKTTYKRLILCAFLTSLAILTRYAGIAIVPTVCLYIFTQKSEVHEKVKKCFCYITLPLLTYILYVVRNYFFTGTLMGPRALSNTGLFSNCDRAFFTIVHWFSPYLFLSAFLLVVAGAYMYIYISKYDMNHVSDFVRFFIGIPDLVKFSFCFMLVYSFFIVTTSTTTAYNLIDDRLMSPVFPFALIIAYFIFLFCHILTPPPNSKTRFWFNILLTLLLLIPLASIGKTIKDVNYRKNNGMSGYHSIYWQSNELISHLKKSNILTHYGSVFSNEPFALFLVDRKISATPIPSKLIYSNFMNTILVYFNNTDLPNTFSLNKLQTICETETLVQTIDGSVIKVGECKKGNTAWL